MNNSETSQYIRNCPQCNRVLSYQTKRGLKRAIENNVNCLSCSKIKNKDVWRCEEPDKKDLLNSGFICLTDEHSKICNRCGQTKLLRDFYKRNEKQRKSICIQCWSQIAGHYNKNNKDKERNRILVKKFGITLEDYQVMLERQNECCNICKRHKSKFAKSLAVDHCHKTGRVRGLLCNWCNRGLAMFKDNPNYFINAAKHVQEDALMLSYQYSTFGKN